MTMQAERHLRLLAPQDLPPPRLADHLAGYEAYLVGEQRRRQGRRRYLWAMTRFVAWLGADATHAELSAASVQRYKEYLGDQGCSGSTVINALATIRDFSRWAIWHGYRNDDPTIGIRRPPKRQPLPNPLYEDEVDLILAAIEYDVPPAGSRGRWYWRRDRLAVLIFLYTGMRLSELAELRRSDVRLRADLILVRAEGAKNGDERTIPLAPPLKRILQEAFAFQQKESAFVVAQVSGKKLSASGLAHVIDRWLSDRVKAYLASIGEETAIHLYPHRLRHTLASHLVWNDVDLRTVQEILGHKQLETTARYTKTDERRKRAALDKLPDYVANARKKAGLEDGDARN
jgi:integrase/recombinase XerC